MKIQVDSSEGVCWLISQTNYFLLCSKHSIQHGKCRLAKLLF